MLTSLTTFFGLIPMRLESTAQARSMVPMAISLAFGIVFATVITLLLVPSLYMILDDLDSWFTARQEPEVGAVRKDRCTNNVFALGRGDADLDRPVIRRAAVDRHETLNDACRRTEIEVHDCDPSILYKGMFRQEAPVISTGSGG